jgi:transposase
MNYNQNERIMQITEKTLLIGVDIASEFHYARAFDYRGIEYGKVISFRNDKDGFESFLSWVEDIKAKSGKSDLMVGMEPTGHYWFCFAQRLDDEKNIKLVLVNPFHVKRSKELDDNNPTKNDRKDPKTIAMLMKDGRYMEPYIPEGFYSELRNAMDTRGRLIKELTEIKNRVDRWLSIYFPEFKDVFSDWEGMAAIMVLKEFPLPSSILDKGVEGIVSRWKEKKIRAVGIKRASNIVKAAENSIGIREGLNAAASEISFLLEQYELLMKQYEKTMEVIEKLVMQIPGVKEVLKIKGVGLVLVAGFFAEVGDIKRFSDPKQIQKYAGLNLKETSSGKHKGKTTISKRGRKRLRSILFQCIMPLVAHNEEFQKLHKHYTTRAENPLKKKQSLILLCCKLIRVIYAITTKGLVYDPEKVVSNYMGKAS